MSELSLPAIFKFKNQMPIFFGLCIFAFACVSFTLFAISHGSGLGFGMFLMLLCLFILVLTGITILGQSNIVIDDQSISRSVFGKTWRTMRWDNVLIISTFPIVQQGFRPRTVRGFSICPSVKPIGKSYLSGKIGFTDGFENMDQLIELINHYASIHGIKLENQANGIRTLVTRL